jgi:hypothetical protein
MANHFISLLYLWYIIGVYTGLVKSAASYAFHRNVDVKDLSKAIDDTKLCVNFQVPAHTHYQTLSAPGISAYSRALHYTK